MLKELNWKKRKIRLIKRNIVDPINDKFDPINDQRARSVQVLVHIVECIYVFASVSSIKSVYKYAIYFMLLIIDYL